MIDLAISRIKSTNPAKRHGVLLMNPGGPGGSGLMDPLISSWSLPPEVRDQYDLIGFDPRGVGKSGPITCGLTPEEQQFQRPYRPETFDSDVAWAKGVADKCREKVGDKLPYITTRNTARDMDTLRTVLGEKKISYLGKSYGTYLGAVYSQMFPQNTDRFVLDSGVDPARVWRGMQQVWAEQSVPDFDRWTKWAAEHNAEFGLGDSAKAVSDTFWALVERADKEPIKFDGRGWPPEVTGDDIRRNARGYAYYPPFFTELFSALKAASEGKTLPSGAEAEKLQKALADQDQGAPAAAGASEPAADNSTAVWWSVVCGDTDTWPRDPGQYAKDAARDKKAYPLFGDISSNIKPCAFWDKPVEQATPMDKKAKNVLIVQNEWDPQTPLTSGQGLHKALKGSRMVTVAGGEGHIVYPSGSCADASVTKYLTTGQLPPKDLTCKNPSAVAEPKPVPNGPNRY
ncbi:alpha/beta hydrolase [Streptomyces bambusae]|uniref:alpha/beta hydrolase n=1 Tax=Streptomyces bambusae TaxID=1550616 RepID=UPI001D000873|nr:alpha/beta hydrolase [Streptomyces bambusae]MCB5170144.1 alpha/beta hydrolase [Streptomyces bambusae]